MAKKAVKVSQGTIDKIKKMGMTKALKKAGKGGSAEYIEGIRRMYGAERLKKAQASGMKKAAPSKMSPRAAEKTMQKTSARAVERGSAKAPIKKTSASTAKIPAGYKRAKTGQIVKKSKLKLPRLSMGVKQYK